MTTDTFDERLIRAANAKRDLETLQYVPHDHVCVIHPDTMAEVREQYVAGCTIAGEPICLTDEQMLGRTPFISREVPRGLIKYMSMQQARFCYLTKEGE